VLAGAWHRAFGTFLAHPLTETSDLPLSPVAMASIAATIVLLVGLLWPGPGGPARARPRRVSTPADPWEGRLTRGQVAGRVVGVALLVLAVAAGRAGSASELENVAPALVVGVGWPVLVVASCLLGAAWRWVDPIDSMARLAARGDRAGGPGGEAVDVRPAVVSALAWTWYLSAYTDTLAPRSVGAGLGLYALAMLAAALAFGRTVALPAAEVFGILAGWLARFRRGILAGPTWQPPVGSEAVLGTLAGGLLFGTVRRSELWGALNVRPRAGLLAAAGLLAFAVAGALTLIGLRRWAARLGDPGSVAGAAIPAVGGVALAVAMAFNRLTTSAQLLVVLASDPFGRGWDLFGTADWPRPPDPAPLGTAGLDLAQVVVLLAGGLAGALVLAQRTGQAGRYPGAAAVALLTGAGVMAATVTAS
jgi:hypothetical protein